MNDIHFEILEHLAIALRLARQHYGNTEDNVFWHEIEHGLQRVSWLRKHSEYDYGESKYKMDYVDKMIGHIESEKITRLDVVPRKIYFVIAEIFKRLF